MKNVQKIGDLRLINLCNVIYKIVAKTLANRRLKVILLSIISPQQSVFVSHRFIIDNIIISYEVLHSLATKVKGKDKFMALKFDLSKAYDIIEWIFLKAVSSVFIPIGFGLSGNVYHLLIIQ